MSQLDQAVAAELEDSAIDGKPISADRQRVVIGQLRRGVTVDEVAKSEGRPRAHIIAAGFAAGLQHHPRTDTMRPPVIPAAGINTAAPTTRITPPAPARRELLGSNAASLLDETADYEDAVVGRYRRHAIRNLDCLRARAIDVQDAEAVRREHAHERMALIAEAEQLKARLADLRSQLQGIGAGGRATALETAATYDGRVVRAWATANGIPCPTRGRFVPNEVLLAYRAAQQTTEGDKS